MWSHRGQNNEQKQINENLVDISGAESVVVEPLGTEAAKDT